MKDKKEKVTLKDKALELYDKHYSIRFIAEFLGTDIMTIKSMVYQDDPNKQFTSADDVPDKKDSKESEMFIPAIRNQQSDDMPAIIKGMTLIGYDLKGISENLGISESAIRDIVENVDELAEAYNEAKWKINIKVVETLLASILPKRLKEKHYKWFPEQSKNSKEVKWEKRLVKEVIKEVGGDVAGLYRWLELMAPEKFSTKNQSLADFLKESGVALVPADVTDEAQWEEMASEQQDASLEEQEEERIRLDVENTAGSK